MKRARVVFSEQAQEVYAYLNKEAPRSKLERMILKAINTKKEFIKTNPHYGVPIAKDRIPLEFKVKYGATNLFRVELPGFWRMLYTLTNDDSEIEIIAFVLDIMDHNRYNKKFGYK
jgi:hypothetical protein